MPAHKQKQLLRLSQLTARPLEWLWPARIAAGTLVLLDGDPGQGKSLLTIDLAARLSTGQPFPDGLPAPPPCSTIILACEDAAEDTILPRCQAAQADISRIEVLSTVKVDGQERPPILPEDCDVLADSIREIGARLVVIDPLLAFVPASSGPLIRQALLPLARLAQETRAAIVMVRHLTKGGRGQRAIHRGIGAMAILGAARTAFLSGPHPDDSHLHILACTKINLAEPPPTLAYHVRQHDSGLPCLDWAGPVPYAADDIVLTPARENGAAVAQAVTFLQETLARGPYPSTAAIRFARANGIAERTLDRAKVELKVQCERKLENGRTQWFWSLPRDLDSEAIMKDLFGLDAPLDRHNHAEKDD